jgi:DNA invertase Pin-like site-specific DNA recombinase
VSSEEQGVSGLGLDAQATATAAELERRGWIAEADYSDIASGKSTKGRPGLAAAVEHARRVRGVLVAARLDRVSRNVIDFASLLNRAEHEGWKVLVLDLPLDTTTAAGRFTALSMANAAELERRLIGERTKAALAAKKARGGRLGPKRKTPDEILRRVVSERDAGATWQSIADRLNADGVPTIRGGAGWRVGTVQRVYGSAELDAEAAIRIIRRIVAERDSGSTWQRIADGLNADRVPAAHKGAGWRGGTLRRIYQSARCKDEG